MNLFSFPTLNISLHIFMKALNCCKAHFVASTLSPSNNILITNIEVNKHFRPEKRVPHVERSLVGLPPCKGIRRKGKCFHYLRIHAIGGESQFGKKPNPLVRPKRRIFPNVRNLESRGAKDMQNGDGVSTETDIKTGQNDLQRTDGTKEKMNDNQKECVINAELLKNIKENENRDDTVSTPSCENEKENFNFLEHFTSEDDNSLVSNLKPEESKELIDSDYFKRMMDDLNLTEEEIMKQLKRSEKNVSSLINKNLSLEQIEKNAKNEEAQNEKLFDTYMNSNSSKVGNFINFKKIGKKYKEVISHVIAIFLSKGKKFTEMIKLIEEKNEINMCISLLEENVLFKNLSKDVLTEIVNKSILFGHLNEKFSNDAENFEWSKKIESCIMHSICNPNFKVKLITYSNNSISVTVVSSKSVHIDSDEHDEIEGSIKNALEEYERANGLDIFSSFNILVHFS
ncbi:conserved Plasmodium protein, unknown function [Plasmodium knowlesi strain H]|uniref:Uncharacterized protein n=3 Tax=Plasmodium knowlesi TaxID=5850 RepID=A0A5K1VC46_PLAKH|nr:conserved Plasmodium protein, unknown function [Plasmodium knowlesi strain H]OTN67679.1 Uncharacterized protein PKNOH_S05390300 [Plasmodium knowlesi]CAA9990490.1 conserved Plasmodium protein, unknown function [Plasmodium knowlesi strain H]SBO19713.1 conserved Plasmodium protein, unknown function [Plasmodium knowlesi strain H]SBO22473.1 conserved Plasmodium protein, unknown function [Plasmodium knowlesi strain H]VVS79964.1 conserved Plasmodium protein, unknown function [Plasmodium knowlesi s|eukprot:XP_002260879.1 hypothetical protein, conserved in Plasmodium species [Plasmodium knowlesi strain H]